MTKPKLIAAFCAVLYFIQAFLHFLILLGLPLGGFFFRRTLHGLSVLAKTSQSLFRPDLVIFCLFLLDLWANSSKPLAQSKAESRYDDNDRLVFISNRF